MKKHSSKAKNVTININILTNSTFSGKKSGFIISMIVTLSITGIVCYKLFVMPESDFLSVLDKLLELLSCTVASH